MRLYPSLSFTGAMQLEFVVVAVFLYRRDSIGGTYSVSLWASVLCRSIVASDLKWRPFVAVCKGCTVARSAC